MYTYSVSSRMRKHWLPNWVLGRQATTCLAQLLGTRIIVFNVLFIPKESSKKARQCSLHASLNDTALSGTGTGAGDARNGFWEESGKMGL